MNLCHGQSLANQRAKSATRHRCALYQLIALSFLMGTCSAFLSSHPTTDQSLFNPERYRNNESPRLFAQEETDAASTDMNGLLSEKDFERACRIDATLQALKRQLPTTLTQRLSTDDAMTVYDESNFRLTVLVEDEEIDLLQSSQELVSLSEVLVLAIQATQRANTVVFAGRSNTNSTRTDCPKFFLEEESWNRLVVPWKAEVPILLLSNNSPQQPFGKSGGGLNQFQGVSEFYLDSTTGKVTRHCIKQIEWNGQSVTGSAVGQTLKALQTTVTNLRRSPLFNLATSNNNADNGINPFNELREGFLEQASAVLNPAANGEAQSSNESIEPCVYPIPSTENISDWDDDTEEMGVSHPAGVPAPGTSEWKAYATSHKVLRAFRQDVLPLLSGEEVNDDSSSLSDFFQSNASLVGLDGSLLLQGKDTLSNFYQGLYLARSGTGGSWTLTNAKVLDWKSRTVAIDFEAINNPLTIKGRDVYVLAQGDTNYDDRRTVPRIQQIRQSQLEATTPDGSLSLDSQWLMKNLAVAVEQQSNGTPSMMGQDIQRIVTDFLLQQSQQPLRSGAKPSSYKRQSEASSSLQRVSPAAAANTFYIMADLHASIPNLWKEALDNNNPGDRSLLLPAEEFLDPNIELKGYLGETLIKGSKAYVRSLSALRLTIRQAIAQKQLLLVSSSSSSSQEAPSSCKSVTLTPEGTIQFTTKASFRLPPPGGVSSFLPESTAVPVQLEITSEYVVDSETGLVVQHRLIETRVNGQLTPGDVWTRRFQRFLNPPTNAKDDDIEDPLRSLVDTFVWFRSLTSS